MDQSGLTRRRLLREVIPGLAVLPALGILNPKTAHADAVVVGKANVRGGFSLNENMVKVYSSALSRPSEVLFISDTHLSLDDARGESFLQYSERMAKGYRQTKHFVTGKPTNPEASFEAALQEAKKNQTDLIVLAGDIVSFPSEAAIEWVMERMQRVGIPWVYTSGNHDWHYEGMEGSSEELRRTWIERRLKPLYQSRDPMVSNLEINGLQVMTIDNSTYEISPQQLEALQQQIESGSPFILAMHIPLYATGRSVGYGCGHPEWGAAKDKNYKIEKRPIWPEKHSQVTMEFHRAVFNAPNLLGVFAGHVHRQTVDVVNGIPQVVSAHNATGAYLRISALPLPT